MRAAVIGGGLGGCAAAIGLRAVGVDVTVYEAADGPRRGGHGLSLFSAGTAALAALGVVDPPGEPVERLTAMHHKDGRPLSRLELGPMSRRLGFPYLSVQREQLLDALLGQLTGSVAYARRCEAVTATESEIQVHFSDRKTEEVDLVVAADGSNSAIRATMWPDEQRRFTSVAWQGEVARPGWYGNPREAVLVRAPCLFGGIFPGGEDRVGWFVEERTDDQSLVGLSCAELAAHLTALPSAVSELIAATPPQAMGAYPVFVRRPPRHWAQGRVVLLGDAAHSLSPSGGQGCGEAFMDAVALAQAIRTRPSLHEALSAYTRARRRPSLMNWRMSLWPLHPILSRVTALSNRLPDRLIAKVVETAMTPAPMVRQALAR